MALVPTDKLKTPQFNSTAIVGPPGTGKTACQATFMRVFDRTKQPNKELHVIDTDQDGAEPLIRLAREGRWSVSDKKGAHPEWLTNNLRIHRFGRVEGIKLRTEDTPNRYQDMGLALIDEINSFVDLVDPRTGFWRTPEQAPGAIVMDSMTAEQEMLWDFILGKRQKEVGSGGGPATVSFPEWELLKRKITDSIKVLKGLPCYVVFVFHEDLEIETVDVPSGSASTAKQIAGGIYRVPKVVGDLSQTILRLFSNRLFATVDNGHYMWQCQPGDRIRSAGSRGRDDLAKMVDQDFTKVLDV